MKTITFFSEKGGVGKSTFSIMFASYLQKMGVKVALADFNSRIAMYRKAEMENRNKFIEKNPESGLKPFDVTSAWPIVECTYKDYVELKRNGTQFPFGSWFDREISEGGRLHDYDIIVCDFPGSISGGEFTQVLGLKKISLVVIPTEKDQMTLQSTLKLRNYLKKSNNDDFCVFVNKAQLGLKNFRSTYMRFGKRLIDVGLPVLPDMVSFSERIMALEKVDTIRSTFAFPDFEDAEYGSAKDLGIINLFIDILRELDKKPDLRGTGKTELPFVKDLVKKNDGRQLHGTPFNDYEID